MSLLTFKGGIHPYEGKELTMDKPIETYLPKGRVGLSVESAYRSTRKTSCEKGRPGSGRTEDC